MDQQIATIQESAAQKVKKNLRISILELTSGNVRFLLRRTDPNVADFMRRTFKMRTPTLALDWTVTDANTSNISNMHIDYRLEKSVLTSDKTVAQLIYPRDCSCGYYCKYCSVPLQLAVIALDEERRITFADLKSENADVKPVIVEPAAEFCKDDNLIIKLCPNQIVLLTAYAFKGVGEDNPKWSPCTCVVQKRKKPEECEGDGDDNNVDPVTEFDVFSTGALKPENIVLMGLREMIKKFELIKMHVCFLEDTTEEVDCYALGD